MSRSGTIWRRCRACGKKATAKRCGHCDSTKTAWTYTVDIAPTGEPRKMRSRGGFETKGQASKALRELLGQIDNGHDPRDETLTLADYIETRWLPHQYDRAQVSPDRIRSSTVDSYRDSLRRHVLPHLGKKRIRDLGPDDLVRLYRDLMGDGLSGSTVRRHVHAVLAKSLKDAERQGLIIRNPGDLVDPPSSKAAPREMLTADQVRALLEHIAADDQQWHAIFTVAAYLGLRRGELAGIQISDLDLDAQTLTVRRQVIPKRGGGQQVSPPKTRAGTRTLRLPSTLVPILRAQARAVAQRRLAAAIWSDGTPWLFPSLDGGMPNASSFSKRFRSYCDDLALPSAVTLHSLRHGVASVLHDAGLADAHLGAILGHASPMVTRSVYLHLWNDDQGADGLEAVASAYA